MPQMKSFYFIFSLVFITFNLTKVSAQGEGNIWYFGNKAGLNFNVNPPVALSDGQLVTDEGCATLCNKDGQLLFYTDGVYVWDKTHTIMPNGTGLGGHSSSAQSALILPVPGDTNLYYIFTVPDWFANPGYLYYSIVDMRLNASKGDVVPTMKKNQLVSNVTEKLVAARASNCTNYWVITKIRDNNQFCSYKIDENGISLPVFSNAGSNHINSPTTGWTGTMKVSPDNKKLAVANLCGVIELFDFDNSTGMVSNAVTLPTKDWGNGYSSGYGLCFSPDCKKLYVGEGTNNVSYNRLYQYDLSSDVPATIIASKTEVGSPTSDYRIVFDMAIGPDGKIYVSRPGINSLGVINFPDALGTACNYVDNGISLGTQTSIAGLPNPIIFVNTGNDSININPSLHDQPICQGDTILLSAYDAGAEYIWQDGSTDSLHMITSPGIYTVNIRKNCANIIKAVTISEIIEPDILGEDTILCFGNTYMLNATWLDASYSWHDNSADAFYNVVSPGKYWVTLTVNNCSTSDTINVAYSDDLTFDLGNDTILCDGETVLLDPGITQVSYAWQDNTTNINYLVSSPGKYWAEVNFAHCNFSDTINIQFTYYPKDFLKDTMLCDGTSYILDAKWPGAIYTWQDNSSDSVYNVISSGKYWVRLNIGNCQITDTSNVTYAGSLIFNLGNDTTLCNGETILLDPGISYASYKWQDNSSDMNYRVDSSGKYWAEASLAHCSFSDTINIIHKNCCDKSIIPNLVTPNNDGLNDYFEIQCFPRPIFVEIYNRWGDKVFESENYNNDWQGKEGVYFYTIHLTRWEIKYSGWIHILE